MNWKSQNLPASLLHNPWLHARKLTGVNLHANHFNRNICAKIRFLPIIYIRNNPWLLARKLTGVNLHANSFHRNICDKIRLERNIHNYSHRKI